MNRLYSHRSHLSAPSTQGSMDTLLDTAILLVSQCPHEAMIKGTQVKKLKNVINL